MSVTLWAIDCGRHATFRDGGMGAHVSLKWQTFAQKGWPKTTVSSYRKQFIDWEFIIATTVKLLCSQNVKQLEVHVCTQPV